MITYQNTLKETKLVNFLGLNVTKFYQALIPALSAAHEMRCLSLNVQPIVLKNHPDPTYLAYTTLVMKFFAYHTDLTVPVSQYLALRTQLEQLSNVYNDSKNEWQKVEKRAGSYLGQLEIDSGREGNNPSGRKCHSCGSPDHYKKDRPKKKATCGNIGGNCCVREA